MPEIPGAPFWFLEPIYCGLIPKSVHKPVRKRPDYPEEYTARMKEKLIKIADYDFAMEEQYDEDELFYDPKAI